MEATVFSQFSLQLDPVSDPLPEPLLELVHLVDHPQLCW